MIHESKLIDESQEDIKGNLNTKKNQLEVRFSEGEDDLSQYLNDGWMILKKKILKRKYVHGGHFLIQKVVIWKKIKGVR